MPSPFPGMDPYLEAPDIWPDFHDRLALIISTELNRTMPGPYYARLESRPEIGIAEEGGASHRVIPDVAVVRHPRHRAEPGGVAVLEQPRAEPSESFDIAIVTEPIRHHFVEVRDPSRGHKLITLIEILSPSNKRPGPDREAYKQKQAEILASDASLIEIDLLRAGKRVIAFPEVDSVLSQREPPPDYVVLVGRAWRRAERPSYQVFPVALRGMLPCINVPLREGEPEVPLDLQFTFNLAYDGGPYRRGAVDYARPPSPPLAPPDAEWAGALLGGAAMGTEGR